MQNLSTLSLTDRLAALNKLIAQTQKKPVAKPDHKEPNTQFHKSHPHIDSSPRLEINLHPIARGALITNHVCPCCGRIDTVTASIGLWYPKVSKARHFVALDSAMKVNEFFTLPLVVERIDDRMVECPSCLMSELHLSPSAPQQERLFA